MKHILFPLLLLIVTGCAELAQIAKEIDPTPLNTNRSHKRPETGTHHRCRLRRIQTVSY